jgi:hypothetical protein
MAANAPSLLLMNRNDKTIVVNSCSVALLLISNCVFLNFGCVEFTFPKGSSKFVMFTQLKIYIYQKHPETPVCYYGFQVIPIAETTFRISPAAPR